MPRRDAILLTMGLFLFFAAGLGAINDAAENARMRRWVEANRWKVAAFDDLFRDRDATWKPGDPAREATSDGETEGQSHYSLPESLFAKAVALDAARKRAGTAIYDAPKRMPWNATPEPRP